MPDIDERLTKVEQRLDKIDARLVTLGESVARIEGRLTNMPTTFQVLTWFVGTAIALSALVFAIARLTSH